MWSYTSAYRDDFSALIMTDCKRRAYEVDFCFVAHEAYNLLAFIGWIGWIEQRSAAINIVPPQTEYHGFDGVECPFVLDEVSG